MNIEEIYEIYKRNPFIVTDSRICKEKSIFIALKGERFDGNLFIEQALNNGCAYAIGDDINLPEHDRIIKVDDSLKLLQKLARYHRDQFRIPVIAITGTNGKTTTKELTATILSEKYNVLYTEGNLNNHIGVPLTLLKLRDDHEIAIIEMGASHPGDIDELVQIADPDYGLITNVGSGHLEGFGSFEGVIKTKGELYEYIRLKGGKIFINHDNIYLNKIAEGLNKIEYGYNAGLYISGENAGDNTFLFFNWSHLGESHYVQTHLVGNYNLENALAAISIGFYFDISVKDINKAVENYIPKNNRSQFKETERNKLVIDAYNANPTSMRLALESFLQMDIFPKALILGDMGELGSYSISEHKKILDFIMNSNFKKVYFCGKFFSSLENNPFPCFDTVELLIESLKKEQLKDYYILLKGSRSNRLEKLIDIL